MSNTLNNYIPKIKNKLMNGTERKYIKIGQKVSIVQKNHQRSGELTEGIIKRILTNSNFHPHGIKVCLESGQIGRVKIIVKK